VAAERPPGGASPLTVLAKLAAIGTFFAVWTALYKLMNEWGTVSSRAIHLTRPCDLWPGMIQPWTAVIYVFGGVLVAFLPFPYNWSWDRLRFVLATYAVASTISFLAYALVPLCITRPEFPGAGLGDRLMHGVLAVDNEANCCPSLHTVFAVLGAVLVAHGGAPRGVCLATAVLAAAVCVTTVTTGQHYLIDVPGGVVTAVASYYGVRRVCELRDQARRGPECRPPRAPNRDGENRGARRT
jgi:membrane-associated phospholipid phosphatase